MMTTDCPSPPLQLPLEDPAQTVCAEHFFLLSFKFTPFSKLLSGRHCLMQGAYSAFLEAVSNGGRQESICNYSSL